MAFSASSLVWSVRCWDFLRGGSGAMGQKSRGILCGLALGPTQCRSSTLRSRRSMTSLKQSSFWRRLSCRVHKPCLDPTARLGMFTHTHTRTTNRSLDHEVRVSEAHICMKSHARNSKTSSQSEPNHRNRTRENGACFCNVSCAWHVMFNRFSQIQA